MSLTLRPAMPPKGSKKIKRDGGADDVPATPAVKKAKGNDELAISPAAEASASSAASPGGGPGRGVGELNASVLSNLERQLQLILDHDVFAGCQADTPREILDGPSASGTAACQDITRVTRVGLHTASIQAHMSE
jgi:hypothetical protein